MATIVSNSDKLNDLEISGDAPVTETLMSKIGANINYLIDQLARITTLETEKNGAVFVGTASGTLISYTVALTSGQAVTLSLSGMDISGFSSFVTTSSFKVVPGNQSAQLDWKRNGSTIRTTNNGGTDLNVNGTFVDTPGVGTFTYTLVVPNTSGVLGPTGSGTAIMRKTKT